MLTGGQVHDSVMLKPALDRLDISQSVVLADKAYGSAENRKYISDRGAQYCIPPKEGLLNHWKCDYLMDGDNEEQILKVAESVKQIK